MSISVQLFSGSADEWDSFTDSHSGYSVFHRFAWKSFIEEVHGHQCFFLVARKDEEIVAALPLVRISSPVFGRFLISIPYVSYGGPVGSAEGIGALVDYAKNICSELKLSLMELRSANPVPLDLPVSHRKVTVVLPLNGGPEEVFKRLPSKLRSQTRRPEKAGIEVRFGHDTIDDFYRVFSRHMRDLGTPAQSKKFFIKLAEKFASDVWFGCSYLDGIPVACGAGFLSGKEFEITWASSLREYNQHSPNMGLYWAFIRRAAAEGLEVFNFGRCTQGSATHRFKLQWGAEDRKLWWYQYSSTGVESTPHADSSAFSLATRIWQRLPIGVTTSLGPRIVRYIP